MSTLVVLDTGVLGMVVHPSNAGEPLECKKWLESVLRLGLIVHVPEIADYELRRELVRINSATSITRLDALKTSLIYTPITTQAMLKAAELWANVRNSGTATADDKALDGDVILAAQSHMLPNAGDQVIVATTNVGHLGLLTDARRWHDIPTPRSVQPPPAAGAV